FGMGLLVRIQLHNYSGTCNVELQFSIGTSLPFSTDIMTTGFSLESPSVTLPSGVDLMNFEISVPLCKCQNSFLFFLVYFIAVFTTNLINSRFFYYLGMIIRLR
ncbi:hypothetical protein L9F63_014420, partial [Diploptera punctata]